MNHLVREKFLFAHVLIRGHAQTIIFFVPKVNSNLLTLCQWTQFPPTGDESFLGVLTCWCLQQEQRDTKHHSKYTVWHQKGTWKCIENTLMYVHYPSVFTVFRCTTPKTTKFIQNSSHLHHSCSRGKEISTHCPGRPHFLQQPKYIQFYWPTVLWLQPPSHFLLFFFVCSSQHWGCYSLCLLVYFKLQST